MRVPVGLVGWFKREERLLCWLVGLVCWFKCSILWQLLIERI
jgi:hypothetical protein